MVNHPFTFYLLPFTFYFRRSPFTLPAGHLAILSPGGWHRKAPSRGGKGAVSSMLRGLAQRADHLLFYGDGAAGLAGGWGKHRVEDLLKRHHMGARLPHAEKAAIAGPVIMLERNGMIVIATTKSGL